MPPPAPVLDVGDPNVFTSAGQPTTLVCEVSGTPEPTIKWTHEGKPLDDERFLVLADHSLFIQDTCSEVCLRHYHLCHTLTSPSSHHHRHLAITLITPSLSPRYHPHHTIIGTSLSPSSHHHWHSITHITPSLSPHYHPHHTITFTCYYPHHTIMVTYYPHHTIIGHLLPSFPSIIIPSLLPLSCPALISHYRSHSHQYLTCHTITITLITPSLPPPSPQDEGSYLVTAENSAGVSQAQIKVTVIKPTPPEREFCF